MKKILFICLLVSLSFGKDIEWMKYKEGLLNNNDKPIFYVLSASYCIFCKRDIKMMNENPTLKKYIEDNFVNIYEERDVENVPSYLDQMITPVYYVLDADGKILDTLKGTQSKDNLLKFLNKNLYKFKEARK